MSWKRYLLAIRRDSEMFVNILTADEKHSLLNRDNLRQPIQMQISLKQKTFSQFVSGFLKSGLSFEYFFKKYGSHSLCISKITNSQKCG